MRHDWGKIWTARRPSEWVNFMIGEKILTNSGYMGPGVNLLENYVLLLHKWSPATLDQLRAALLEEWDNIPMRRINVLMNSMHRRIRAVTDTRGRGEREAK
jgi:hypothetical protein